MTSDVIATRGKLILFKDILLSFFLQNNRVIVIKNKQKIFQLHLQLLTFENVQLQLQQNRVIDYNFVNYNIIFPSLVYTVHKIVNLRA